MKSHLVFEGLTEACEAQEADNARSGTLFAVIRSGCRCWQECGCQFGRGRTWLWCRHNSCVVTADRALLAIGRVLDKHCWTFAECGHDVQQAEAGTSWRLGLQYGYFIQININPPMLRCISKVRMPVSLQ